MKESTVTIVDGRYKPGMNKKKILFGKLKYVYTETNNNMETRSFTGISLISSNDNGGNCFINLETGKRIYCYVWTYVHSNASLSWYRKFW